MSGEPGPLIDTHVHLWDPRRFEYPWLARFPALRRTFGPLDLDTDGQVLSAAVLVEADCIGDQAAAEVEWIEEIASAWPLLAAVVAQVPLERGAGVTTDLRRLSRSRLVRGVRRNTQDEPRGFAAEAGYVAGVRLLAEYGFTADLCVRHQQLPDVIALVSQVPEVTFVLDHLGKPDVRAGEWESWAEAIRRLAAASNVACKLSGLTTEADWARWSPSDVLPYLRHALTEFGPERCMFGSDWPVATLATRYGGWVAAVRSALADRPAADGYLVWR
ncbi:amidohydrolase family protein, partial [Actinoplanes sp. NPDC051633]|uniref:amidohydrolase family protein n=1 Tax=Actinoplanes sp. NPDC051633 TaxID=3155670 RepID=UPI0034328AAF